MGREGPALQPGAGCVSEGPFMVEGQAGRGPSLGRQEPEQGCCRPGVGWGKGRQAWGPQSFCSGPVPSFPSQSCLPRAAGGGRGDPTSFAPLLHLWVGRVPRGCTPLARGLAEACQPGAVFFGVGGAAAGPHDHHGQAVGTGPSAGLVLGERFQELPGWHLVGPLWPLLPQLPGQQPPMPLRGSILF